MQLQHHTAFSITISGILYLMFKSWGLAIACLISGIFIDLDHLVDVIREHGWSVRVKEFFDICRKAQFDRILLVWHGWEWVILLGEASWQTGWNPWITGVFIGISQHVVLDSLFNTRNPLSYSLIWRWRRDFHFDTIFPKYTAIKYRHR